MRDLSKVKQKSLQQTYELPYSAQVPCAFTLQLQQQSCSLEKGSLVLGEGLPQTQGDSDCQVESLKKMVVAQCVTISFILHAKKRNPPFVLTAQELVQSIMQILLERELLVWSHVQAPVCISGVRWKDFNWF